MEHRPSAEVTRALSLSGFDVCFGVGAETRDKALVTVGIPFTPVILVMGQSRAIGQRYERRKMGQINRPGK